MQNCLSIVSFGLEAVIKFAELEYGVPVSDSLLALDPTEAGGNGEELRWWCWWWWWWDPVALEMPERWKQETLFSLKDFC